MTTSKPAHSDDSAAPVLPKRGRPTGTKTDPLTLQRRTNVTLDIEHQEIARRAGNGNVSAGMRVALDAWAKKHQEKTK